MALSAATVWEIRLTSGSDSNGGGFVAGSGGTDWSFQNSAHATLTTSSVVNATTTKITVAAGDYTVAAGDVGNIVQITGGTATAGFYQIITATTGGSQSWTLDRSCGTAGQTVVAKMGGALLTISGCMGPFAAGNKAFVKGESGGSSTATTTLSAAANVTRAVPPNRLIGYTSSRTDGGQATLTLATNTGLTGLNLTGNGWYLYNLVVDCASLGTSTGIAAGAHPVTLHNCKIANATTAAFTSSANGTILHRCEFTGCTSAATAAVNITSQNTYIDECSVHDNACPGISSTGATVAILGSLITNNTGASSDGIVTTSNSVVILGNTIHGNGRHGINGNGNNVLVYSLCKNNSISGNGGFGIVGANAAGIAAEPWFDGDAFGYPVNTSGTRSNMDDTSANAVNGASPYTNVFDVTVSVGTQYNNATTGNAADWSLNATASQGALLDYAGQPATWPGETGTTGYPSIGAVQYKNAASGAGMLVHPGMGGGARG